MADWKSLVKSLVLADGVVDPDETKVIQNAIFEDDTVDKEELEFLMDLRVCAKSKRAAFEDFFFQALKKHILTDGKIDAKEVATIQKLVVVKGKVDTRGKKFLKEVKAEANKVSKKFDTAFAKYLK